MESSTISQSTSILNTNRYSSASTKLPSITNNTSSLMPALEFTIQENIPVDISKHNSQAFYTTLSYKNDIFYYYQQDPPPSIATNRQEQEAASDQQPSINIYLLYNEHKHPLWQLTHRDRYRITLKYQQHYCSLTMMASPQFRFTFSNQTYYWQMQPTPSSYALKCYQIESEETVIADLQNNRFSLFYPSSTITNNPFRQQQQQQQTFNSDFLRIDPFTTLLVLTGLLVNQYVKNRLPSSDGGNALPMIVVKPNDTTKLLSDQINVSRKSNDRMDYEVEQEEDTTSISSSSNDNHNRNYPGHQNLVDDSEQQGNRWSTSVASFKSIELDSGLCHCWWGYTCWWSWFPFCMPGGWCDRIYNRITKKTETNNSSNNNRPNKITRSTRTLSKQGWQQQHY
ncbi:uncharacterized protein BX663DRAFT_510219 [Cokeromyces recurvatus]|uniref:uncharacterized protein n=1 Tax=Cokeromyces recurvatus TaxID=90255 RepID=UPI00222039EF|nr:uncharacterized protein BX663DRAFT_510219 [Cokeromyces recurvatus]KAI7902711.1 hypothetical protein BX663DRAFT_510219 [Cokeromyces recurvatus]